MGTLKNSHDSFLAQLAHWKDGNSSLEGGKASHLALNIGAIG
jgi:hypothetical protein